MTGGQGSVATLDTESAMATGKYFGQDIERVEDRLLAAPIPDQHARLDQLELAMLGTGAAVELPVSHTFTPGCYRRTILMPAGKLITSRIHNTEHQFVVVAGSCSVYIPGVGVELIQAPYFGITKPGTRRVLYIHQDTVWATYHPTLLSEDEIQDIESRVAAIEGRIIERRELQEGRSAFELYSGLLEEAKAAGLLIASAGNTGEQDG